MNISPETPLTALAAHDEAATKEVLARFAIIHCTGCSVPALTVGQAAEHVKVPLQLILNALQAEVKVGA